MTHALSLLFALATAASLQAQETLKFKDPARNPDLEGDIVGLTDKTVEIVTGGVKQTLDARRVVEIVPSAARKTPDYLKGEEAAANGSFAAAVERFERVATDGRAPESLRQLAAIRSVRAAAANSDHAGVVQAAQVLRARKKDGFFLHESFQLEVKSHLALGNGAGAAAALKAFAAAAPGHPSVDLLEAALAESQNNWKGALARYRKLLRDPDAADPAALGEMRCLTAQADWPGLGATAEAHLKNAMGKRDFNPRILIASYTGKGDVDLNAGKAKEALLNYLQGAIVLSKGEKSPEHEEALARSATACAKLAVAEKDAARKARYRAQAQEMLQEFARTYPGSRYRTDIDQRLRELR
jgi:hypothetical protein